MSTKCSASNCERISQVLCQGCKFSFCQEHIIEHGVYLHLQLNPLITQSNQIIKDLKTLNVNSILHPLYQNLEEWRKNSHQMIEDYYRDKTRDLNVYINEKIKQYARELQDIQTKIDACKRDQQSTHEQINTLSLQIQYLENNINKIKQRNIPLYINPLTIEPDLIDINQYFYAAALPSVYKYIDRNDETFTPLATNNELLLLYRQNTLVLLDKELAIYKYTPWTFGSIYDMCYSATLNRFIILTENEVYLLNEENMSINKVRSIPWQEWFSCTCSETALYLSTKVYNSSIIEFHLLPTIAFDKKWASDDICANNEAIDGINYKNNTLAIMISNDVKRLMRLELRSAQTLQKIWSIPLDIIYNEKLAYRFCSINYNEWLVADHTNLSLLQITRDGQMKARGSYELPPCCVIEFGNDTLAISTQTVVHLHKL